MTVRIQRTDPPAITPQTVALVPEALLPLLGWRDVPILREVRQELTALERFVLEMALKLQVVTAEDFAEIVSLPQQVLAAGATRLLAGGALRLAADRYEVEPEAATRALHEKRIRRLLPSTADFVLLPRTGDILAMPSGKKTWLRQLELARLVPTANAPVPAELWHERRSSFLADRVRAGSVTLVDTGVAHVPTPADDPPLFDQNGRGDTRLCPAYRCRAEVTLDEHGEHVVRAVLHGRTSRKKNTAGSDRTDEPVEVPVQLSGMTNLVHEWLTLTAGLTDPTVREKAWQVIGPAEADYAEISWRRARRRGPVEWDFPLTERAAQAIAAQRRPLDQQVGLALENDTATVVLICWFVPDDDEARRLFAIDLAVRRLLTAADAAADLTATCEKAAAEHDLPADRVRPQAVRDRAWDLGYHRLIYALREAEDFPYD